MVEMMMEATIKIMTGVLLAMVGMMMEADMEETIATTIDVQPAMAETIVAEIGTVTEMRRDMVEMIVVEIKIMTVVLRDMGEMMMEVMIGTMIDVRLVMEEMTMEVMIRTMTGALRDMGVMIMGETETMIVVPSLTSTKTKTRPILSIFDRMDSTVALL
ncbi:hypothetical protein SISSUDRAFT_752952 [Sistotremastrum suecicum HHB10207 ss-3]|uniref:Uncharacterized protein n=1 Tax=Sistotremastrum suecicum HHB10207 ss-3 TaxID=1314776 RepID=A0A166DEF0_9AGAM|nr:hypothetical protein SISSUDRAFT_752952 [Sistotremastrum suecicum HHB10207 ss-3]